MLTLEKYKGSVSRHACPACGAKKKFSRYIDKETGHYLADHVGRCDRESSCGYHLKPSEYFASNGNGWKANIRRQGRRRENGSQANYSHGIANDNLLRKAKVCDVIENKYLLASLRNYEQNNLLQFIANLFPYNPETAFEAAREYKIGTGRNGEAIFWQIDRRQRIRTGKLMAYDRETGKRRKDRTPDWIHATLKRAGNLSNDFELNQCFFGEHLLSKYPGRTIAIVESEKTAVIASLCQRVFPDLVWLASGGLSNLKADSLARIANGRKLILFPDANGFDKWQAIALEARKRGIAINVSDLLEKASTDAEKRDGLDLADYLIAEQRRRNDPAIRAAFRDLILERLGMIMSDNGVNQDEAERQLAASGFVEFAERSVLVSG